MHDWNIWLNSKETRTVVKVLEETIEELLDTITDGSHLQEKSIEKVALDYTYSMAQLEGLRIAIETIKDIREIDSVPNE